MSPDNIGSAINRFSGWPSNDPLKTDNESMTSPVTVQVIKMIAAILDPHRIVVGIDTLYTTQRKTFTSEGQQLIESALKTLNVMNLNNLETDRDEEGNYLAFGYNVDTPDRITVSAYNEKKPFCYGQCLLIQDEEPDLFNLVKIKIFEARHNYVSKLMSDPEFMFKFSYSAQQNRLEPHLLVPTYFPLKTNQPVTLEDVLILYRFFKMNGDFNILTSDEYMSIMTPLMKCERSVHDHNRYVTGKDALLLDNPPSGNQIYFHISPDESATLVLYFSDNNLESFVFENDIPSQYRHFKMFTNLALVIDQLTDANQIL